jgi:putative transposase
MSHPPESVQSVPTPLSGLPDEARTLALARFQAIRPFLEDGVSLAHLAREQGIVLRTARRWVDRYRREGLIGLARKERGDKDKRKLTTSLQQLIEGLALRKPGLPVATIHRQVVEAATKLGQEPPSYKVVHTVIGKLEPALVTLAHEGAKAYSASFDLVHRREADAANAIWQADHTELDILVKDTDGTARRPWLTIIIDDYSRAVAGYLLSFTAPSAIQTALALRQAIWRKSQPGWHVCGIPQILYTDHGSDFTSHHIEQVAADLKIRLIFSGVARPRGRGKIERFFDSLSQVLFSRLPGYSRTQANRKAVLSLADLAGEIETYLIGEYLVTPHSTTGQAPQARWEAGGFLPQMPDSLERLDLLLLTVARTRKVQQDGIRFMGMRYIDPTLAAYVGEEVMLRYDPRDVAEVRLFHQGRFLCRAVCQELAGATVPLRDIVSARNRRRRELRQTIVDRRRVVDSLLEAKRWDGGKKSPVDERVPPTFQRKYALRTAWILATEAKRTNQRTHG